jgi:hypothetical protein
LSQASAIEEAYSKIKNLLRKAGARLREALIEAVGAAIYGDIPRTGGRYVAVAMLRAVNLNPSPILRGAAEVYFSATQTS